jgi:hypothetical protein
MHPGREHRAEKSVYILGESSTIHGGFTTWQHPMDEILAKYMNEIWPFSQ